MNFISKYMGMDSECDARQMIDGDGIFDGESVEHFMKSTRVDQCHLNYVVVAIMGPQSSGKSTLLNKLFATRFVEMNASKGRNQTTKGIWIAKCSGIEPPTIVMDVEGTDGKERGENDATFEKQSTLFALATADILLINMWCHDIGREHGANKPLLRIVFRAMLQLFSPRRTTLLFVIRDKSKTPLEILDEQLREQIQEIWSSVNKENEHQTTPIDQFFHVVVVALSSYDTMEDKFNEEVDELRQRFMNSIEPGGLAGEQRLVPASAFSVNAKEIWKIIKENKNLDFPSHQVLVATFRCEEIANDTLNEFIDDQDLAALLKDTSEGRITQAGVKLRSILDKYLVAYEKEASFFDVDVKNTKRQRLAAKALEHVSPHFSNILQNIASKTLENFKASMELCLKESERFSETASSCEKLCIAEFDGACEALKIDAWDSLRNLVSFETNAVIAEFLLDVSRFEMDKEYLVKAVQGFSDHARSVIENEARNEAKNVSTNMKSRFSITIAKSTKDVKSLTRAAQMASLGLLSVMAVIRWENKPDGILKSLESSLLDKSASQRHLTSTTWDKVTKEDTIIEPVQCASLWKELMQDVEPMIKDAEIKEERKRKNDEYVGAGDVLVSIWQTMIID